MFKIRGGKVIYNKREVSPKIYGKLVSRVMDFLEKMSAYQPTELTKQELCDKYEIKESIINNHFSRAQDQIRKKYGVFVIRQGQGKNARFYEILPAVNEVAEKIEFMKDVYKTISMEQATFTGLIDWEFMVFLGVITCPFGAFRGDAPTFLKFLGLSNTGEENSRRLFDTINILRDRGLVNYALDLSTDDGYFSVWVIKSVETGMKISVEMIQRCMKLQKDNRMLSWVPLLKTWVGLQFLTFNKDRQDIQKGEQVLFTMDELEDLTGINKKMLTKCKKILESDNLFNTSRVFRGRTKCIGQSVVLNGIECHYEVEDS